MWTPPKPCEVTASEVATHPATAWDGFHQPQSRFALWFPRTFPRGSHSEPGGESIKQTKQGKKKKTKNQHQKTINRAPMPGIQSPLHGRCPQLGGSSASQGGHRSCGYRPREESDGTVLVRGAAEPPALPSRDSPASGPGAAWKSTTGSRNHLFFTRASRHRRVRV